MLRRLQTLSSWHFLWITILLSEILTALSNSVLSLIWFGQISRDLLLIGAIDAFVVSLIVAAIVIYFLRHTAVLESVNQALRREVTERAKVELSLSESEQRYRELFVNARDGLFLTTDGGVMIDANLAFCELCGIPRQSVVGQHGSRCLAFLTDEWLRQTLTAGALETSEIELPRGAEDRRLCLLSVAIYTMANAERTIQGSLHDITDKRRMEQDLARTEKLESIGLLAGGIAHDFNNLLVAILGSVTCVKEVPTIDEETRILLADAEQACFRARDLTRQLLTFSRGGDPVKRAINLGEQVRSNVDFALRGSRTKAHYEIPAELWRVDADEGQLGQVIHNLAINAVQAMPDGGKLQVSCENLPADSSGGRWVRVELRDQGHGIPPEIQQRIFEPYFTTKSSGSGLGLATCYSILKKHGGSIEVVSRIGEGALFRFTLPVALREAPEPRALAAKAAPHSGRVLLVDDDDLVRGVAARMLQRLGCSLEVASDAKIAIELYQAALQSGSPFGVVIMDLTFPGGMGGEEAAAAILSIDPQAKMIVSSGYSNSPVIASYRQRGFKGILRKPYSLEQLSQVLAQLEEGGD